MERITFAWESRGHEKCWQREDGISSRRRLLGSLEMTAALVVTVPQVAQLGIHVAVSRGSQSLALLLLMDPDEREKMSVDNAILSSAFPCNSYTA